MIIKSEQDRLVGIPLVKTYNKEEREKMTPNELQVSVQPVGTLTLFPGMNYVDDEKWALAKPHVADLIKAELLIELEEKTSSGPGKPVTVARAPWQLPPKVAKKLVGETQDPVTLREWDEREVRPEIRALLTRRMEELDIMPSEADATEEE